MSAEQVIIVGGGVSGLALNQYLRKNFSCNPLIFSLDRRLGGVLRDLENGSQRYFRGVQYLDDKIISLLDVPHDTFYCFTHRYGSFNDLEGLEYKTTDCAGPCFLDDYRTEDVASLASRISNFNSEESSLHGRLDLYPNACFNALTAWVQSLGIDPIHMHHSVADSLFAGSGRVFFSSCSHWVKELRSVCPSAERFYGLSRTQRDCSLPTSYLPHAGFSSYFDNVEVNRTQFLPGTAAIPRVRDGKFQVFTKRMGVVDSDLTIWTGDPSLLSKSILGVDLDSDSLNIKYLFGHLDRVVSFPFYIQVYSQSTKILRIYIYNINGQGSYTIEKVDDRVSLSEDLYVSNYILKSFDLAFQMDFPKVSASRRYTNLTLTDSNVLGVLASEALKYRVLLQDFRIFDRSARIQFLTSSIDEILRSC